MWVGVDGRLPQIVLAEVAALGCIEGLGACGRVAYVVIGFVEEGKADVVPFEAGDGGEQCALVWDC